MPFPTLELRPYQLLCLICRSGGNPDTAANSDRLAEIAQAVHRDPCLPVTLRCNVTSHYRYQNPGADEDTPGGTLFNTRRDLAILQRLGLAPGDTRPAWELLRRVLEKILSIEGICESERASSGCPSAGAGHYERGAARGIDALIPPRPAEEMARAKAESAQVVLQADALHIRPHHLMCMACFHGGRTEPAPLAEDNLYEAVVAVQRRPDLPITLEQGPCDICPPCPHFDPATRLCLRNNAMGLRDEKKDLDLLERLDLQYGDTVPARELFTRLFRTIRTTTEICGSGDGVARGWEWTVCGGPDGNDGYRKAREAGLGIPGISAGLPP